MLYSSYYENCFNISNKASCELLAKKCSIISSISMWMPSILLWAVFKYVYIHHFFLVKHSSNNLHLYHPLLLLLLLEILMFVYGAKTSIRQPPEHLCIKHQDWWQFIPSNGAAPQSLVMYTTRMYIASTSNVHCEWSWNPAIYQREVHKQHLATVFGFEL